jgi:putative transcriptional regulator
MKAEKMEKYQYTACGLTNVYLVGVKKTKCSSCGEEEIAIPDVEGLHGVLANMVATKKARITHQEIRFLRTFLGFSSKDLAATISVAPETISRWENGGDAISLSMEKFLRLMIISKFGKVIEYSTLEEVSSERPTKTPTEVTLARSNKGWNPKKVA